MGMAGLAQRAGNWTARRGRSRARPGRGSAHRYGSRAALFNAAALLAALMIGAPAAAGKAPFRILALGDSIMAGYGLAGPDSLPARLEAALRQGGREVEVIDGGVSGDTTAGGLARLGWMLGEKPDAVIVELGGNDGLRGLDPKQTYANLDEILTRLGAARVKVLLTGMLAPPNLGREYGREFNAIYPALAERHHCLFYPFILDGVAAKPGLNQADGIHPNAQGVEVIVTRLVPYVDRLMGG